MFNAIGLHNFMFHVSNQRITNFTDAAFFYRNLTPGVMHEFRIERHADDFHATFFKLFITLVKSNNLGRADKGKVHRPEKNHGGFALDMALKIEIIDDFTAAQYSCGGKIWCLTGYQYHDYSCKKRIA